MAAATTSSSLLLAAASGSALAGTGDAAASSSSSSSGNGQHQQRAAFPDRAAPAMTQIVAADVEDGSSQQHQLQRRDRDEVLMDETQLIDEEQVFSVHGHVDGLVDGDGLDQAEQVLNLSDHDADTGGGRAGFSAQDLRNHNVHNLKSVAEIGIVMDNLYNEMKHHKPGNTGGRGRPAADWPAIGRAGISRKWHDFKSRHNIPPESKTHNTEALGKLCLELIHERYWVSPPTLTFAQLQGKEVFIFNLSLIGARPDADPEPDG